MNVIPLKVTMYSSDIICHNYYSTPEKKLEKNLLNPERGKGVLIN